MNSPLQKFSWVLCLVGIFATGRALACECPGGCPKGQYCEEIDEQFGTHACVSCPSGTTTPASGGCYYQCSGSDDCTTNMQNCAAGYYNKTCNLVGGGAGYKCALCNDVSVKFPKSDGGYIGVDKCRTSDTQCDGSYCHLYYDGTSNCTGWHPEYFINLMCVPSTWACSNFYFDSTPDITLCGNKTVGQWQKTDQQGNATWNGNGWNFDACRLEKTITNITTNCSAGCDTGVAWRTGARAVWNADEGHYDINYNNGVDWYYCTKCGAGKSPLILDTGAAQDNYGCMAHGNTQYLACTCENVADGFYSDGCTISYPLSDPKIPNGCRNCGSGTGLVLSADACVPDSTEYCDDIGCFTLGGDASLCR